MCIDKPFLSYLKFCSLALWLSIPVLLHAQHVKKFTFSSQVVNENLISTLDEKLSKFQSVEIPSSAIFDFIKDGDVHEIEIITDEFSIRFKIWENDLISKNASVRTSEGKYYRKEQFGVKTFDLQTDSGERGALTIGPDYISGIIGNYYIQPLHEIIGGKNTRQYIIFSEENVLNYINLVCEQETKNISDGNVSIRSTQCFKGDVDIADDFSFYQHQGNSITNVQNWNISKLNTTKTRFDNEFSNPIQYTLDEQFIVTSAATEPWPLNITISALLTQFAYWSEGNIGGYSAPGFNTTPNQASLWNNRSNITGPFGVAYNGEFCSYYGYNVIKWVSTLSDKLQTHEMGHGMNMAHVNPANTIYYMNATISSAAAQWKVNNADELQNYLASSICANPMLYCPALPIELYKLEAYPFDCNDIIFKWITASELNTDYFIVERAAADLDFKKLATVKANGQVNQLSFYEYRDQNPFPNLNYYRITSVDFDGKQEIHPIRSVKNVCKQTNFIKGNFVEDGILKINYDAYCSEKVYIISDLSGNILKSGEVSPTIQATNLPTGMYFLRIQNTVEKFFIK